MESREVIKYKHQGGKNYGGQEGTIKNITILHINITEYANSKQSKFQSLIQNKIRKK